MSVVDTSVDIRPYRDGDEAAVVALLRASLGEGPTGRRTREFFRWKHLLNPFGRSIMLVAEADGSVVGFRAFLRWRFTADGASVSAVRAVDTATHPAHQGRGIFRRLTLAALEELSDVDLIFNTPNAKSGPGYVSMGWRTVGRMPLGIRVKRPIRFARLARRQHADVDPQEAPIIEAERVSESTGWIGDPLKVPSAQLRTLRTTDYLRWRYGEVPALDYRVVNDGANQAVFRVRARGTLWEAAVVELFATDRPSATRLLRRVARAAPVDYLTCSFPKRALAAASARSCGFIPYARGPLVVTNVLRRLPADATSVGGWDLTLGDIEVF